MDSSSKHQRRLWVALVRHGAYQQPRHVPSAHLPHPLTAEGIAQSRAAAGMLQDAARERDAELESVIDCSSLLRAWQTARVLAAALAEAVGRAFRLEETAALAERGLGAAANLTMEEIAAAVAADPRHPPLPDDWKSRPDFVLPFLGAESLLQAGERTARWIADRCEGLARDSAAPRMKVFVGHGASLRWAAVRLGALDAAEAPRLSMFCGRPVILEREPTGRFRHVAGEWKVRRQAVRPAGGD